MADENIYWNTPTNIISRTFGALVIDIGTSAAYVSSQPCRGCLIKAGPVATVYINFNAAATNTCPQLDQSYIPLPISSLSAINILGTATATVHIIWRN